MQVESDEIQLQDRNEEEDKHYSNDQKSLVNIENEFESRDFDDSLGADTTDLDNTTYFETTHKLKSGKRGEW